MAGIADCRLAIGDLQLAIVDCRLLIDGGGC
jgi:hypothetical protein